MNIARRLHISQTRIVHILCKRCTVKVDWPSCSRGTTSMSGREPPSTQSAGDIASHDDTINTVSGSRESTSLRKATSDAHPAGDGGARTRDDQLSPTSGAQRGRRTSRPIATTQSSPETAAAAAGSTTAESRSINPQLPDSAQLGDHLHSSDSDVHLGKQDGQKTKKTSLCKRLSRDCRDKTSNSVVVVVDPQNADPPSDFASGYRQTADSARTTVGASQSSRWTSTCSQKEPLGFGATSVYSRQRFADDPDPTRRKVKSEGQRSRSIFLLNSLDG